MARMGHASTRAAQIYLHTTSQRDVVVAEALNKLLTARSGTVVARGEIVDLELATGDDEGPGIRGLQRGAGDGNRTRTVSLGS
jgi:hypothetical protein